MIDYKEWFKQALYYYPKLEILDSNGNSTCDFYELMYQAFKQRLLEEMKKENTNDKR